MFVLLGLLWFVSFMVAGVMMVRAGARYFELYNERVDSTIRLPRFKYEWWEGDARDAWRRLSLSWKINWQRQTIPEVECARRKLVTWQRCVLAIQWGGLVLLFTLGALGVI